MSKKHSHISYLIITFILINLHQISEPEKML